jgi:hypothetical protein
MTKMESSLLCICSDMVIYVGLSSQKKNAISPKMITDLGSSDFM